MSDAVLVINAGSSSVKFALFALTPELAPAPALSGQIEGIGSRAHIRARDASGRRLEDVDLALSGDLAAQHRQALEHLLGWLDAHDDGFRVAAAGHRVVHGGERFSRPLRITPDNLEALAALVPLAPLHQPHNLNAIRAIARVMPALPQVACFDTAFHRSQPHLAQLFGLPRRLTEEGIRRYGFHGLSYEYVAGALPALLGTRAAGRVVVAHLGNGASMCAMKAGRSLASTMGFTAVEGLMMGTRSGSVDPGVLLYLMQHKGWDAQRLTDLLYKESGLLGVSGESQDMRALLASARAEAREAVELFCYRITRELGSLAAALGGLDALVFTGGIGEHAAAVRDRVCRDAAWLGVELDAAANARNAGRISTAGSAVDVLVVPTDEERMIARHTAALLGL